MLNVHHAQQLPWFRWRARSTPDAIPAGRGPTAAESIPSRHGAPEALSTAAIPMPARYDVCATAATVAATARRSLATTVAAPSRLSPQAAAAVAVPSRNGPAAAANPVPSRPAIPPAATTDALPSGPAVPQAAAAVSLAAESTAAAAVPVST